MTIFAETSYKQVLRRRLLEKKKMLGSINFQGLAKACRVQKTYVSRVFNADAHFNEDQVYLACLYLGFSDHEKDFILQLHAAERSQLEDKRRWHLAKADEFRRKSKTTEAHLKAEVLAASAADLAAYYIDPRMLLAHTFLSVPEYAAQTRRIAERLRISKEELSRILGHLERLGIVELEGGQYVVRHRSLTLPDDSPIKAIFRKAMRYKLLDKLSDERDSGAASYSAVFSADEATFRKIHADFLELLRRAQEMVADAPHREVYQLNFDLERWG
jgi:hypothetical protein